jgi:hypothetical protein
MVPVRKNVVRPSSIHTELGDLYSRQAIAASSPSSFHLRSQITTSAPSAAPLTLTASAAFRKIGIFF